MSDPDKLFFDSIPWCSRLLSDPNYIVVPTRSRQRKESTEDELFAKTFHTQDTIRAGLTLSKKPEAGTSWVNEVCMLLGLEKGVNGYSHVLHGGIVGTIIDETMGLLLVANKDVDASVRGVTAYLNVTYLKPIATPQTVLVVAKFREVKGRKYYVDAEVRDGQGAVLARGEALWIGIKKSMEKL
ncbi:hypothetical protein MMC28_000184 [Mycoblastus sanguinarius]|nr:hypothetical protein [Mycoblastus sanguinarius]